MSFSYLSVDGLDSYAVLLSVECRALRRSLRPLAWVTLEEVALDAVLEDGRLVARTSARQVAERLGVDPVTAATALRALRRRGLVSLAPEKGAAHRFGMSIYELGSVAGLSVVGPCASAPNSMSPAGSGVTCRADSAARPSLRNKALAPPALSLKCPGQEAFDLGSVSS